MNRITLYNFSSPILCGMGHLVASEPFYHADRVADFNVMIYVSAGRIYVTEAETDYEIGPGELFFLKKGLRHYGKVEIPKGTDWYYAHFYINEEVSVTGQEPECFSPDIGPLPKYEPSLCYAMLPKKMSGLAGSELEEKIARLADYYHSFEPDKKWKINHRMFELLSAIAFYESKEHIRVESLSDRIGRYLSESYEKPFSAKDLESRFFLSYKYMAAVFKKETGLTMQQFHTAERISRAKRLLRTTLIPVGAVAEAVGFSDMLYFSRIFHRETGMSPSDYRRKLPEW